MLAFHPYGGQDIRVVSDLSRFDFENAVPRNRSRNTTPNSIKEEILQSESTLKNPSRTQLDNDFDSLSSLQYSKSKARSKAELSEYAPQNEIYQYYMKPSTTNLNFTESVSELAPYPASVKQEASNTRNFTPGTQTPRIPTTPRQVQTPKNFMYPSPNVNKELPPISTVNDYFHPVHSSTLTINEKGSLYPESRYPPMEKESNDSSDVRSFTTRQKDMEEVLIRLVMNRPLFSIDLNKFIRDPNIEAKSITITANLFLYIFEVISAIIVITLSAILASKDTDIGKGFYRYFIADQVLSMLTALLFITTVINFEKRNGSFYCTAACLLTIVSFIMVVAIILPHNHCPSKAVCDMRKAVSSFIIISTIVWISDLVMFLTTVYISRLNLLEDINFDYSNRGLSGKYNGDGPEARPVSTFDHTIDPTTGKPWPQYYMRPEGEIVEYDGSFNTNGVQRLIVYVPY